MVSISLGYSWSPPTSVIHVSRYLAMMMIHGVWLWSCTHQEEHQIQTIRYKPSHRNHHIKAAYRPSDTNNTDQPTKDTDIDTNTETQTQTQWT